MGLRLLKPNFRYFGVERKEKPVSDYIPYLCHYDDNTLITKKGHLISTLKIGGFSFETADDEDLENKKNGRNNFFKNMASGNLGLYFHTIRKKYTAYPEGDFDVPFAIMLNNNWKEKHNPEHVFINEHYLSIVRKSPPKLATSVLNKVQGKAEEDSGLKEAYSELEEIRERLVNGLANYKVKPLGIKHAKTGAYCEMLEFLSYIVNCGYNQKTILPRMSLDKYIANNRLYVGSKSIQSVGPNFKKFAGIVSLKEYRPATYAGILDGFLQLPCEFIITQSYTFTDRLHSISKMQLQQRRLIQSEDVAVSQIQEINEALDAAMSGAFAFGDHHLSIMCMHNNLRGLDNVLSQAVVEFANCGIAAVRENINMEATFWGQLPGNFEYAVRKSTINTLNLSGYCSFHNYPAGKAKGNYWGNAVTVFNTASGTPYFFSFHARDVGHTMIIGPTGAGKTVLLNFLCAQAQKFKPRLFFFDKDRGAEIFIRAVGGKCISINPATVSGFNPLQLPDTPDNRNFIEEWLKTLVTVNGETITAEDILLIQSAINGNYGALPHKDRRLGNVAPYFGMQTPGSLASRLSMWYGSGSKAGLFDNPKDMIDFNEARSFCFDMTEILKDKVCLAPALLYIFHRISISLDGSPTMIVLDEAWALIDNPVFAPKIKDWLKVLRKLNAFVVFATQSVEDAAKSRISDTLVQQTATQIYLPNLKATPVYREIFMLSQREFAIVKNTDPSSRFFLIKQDTDGVVARIDLSGMTDDINILSGRADTVILLDQMREKYGDNPSKWLTPFLKAAREL